MWMDLDFSMLHFPKTTNNFVAYFPQLCSTLQYSSIAIWPNYDISPLALPQPTTAFPY